MLTDDRLSKGTIQLDSSLHTCAYLRRMQAIALLNAADQALYAAKHAGRDRVVAFDPALLIKANYL